MNPSTIRDGYPVPGAGSGIPGPVFALVAGEDSGDLLGAELIAALRRLRPHARFVGIGGPRMHAAGFEAWHDIGELSVMGVAEVLRHLPRLVRLRRSLAHRLMKLRPDAVIGIDAPDFNLGLERILKRTGIRTVHYVSPSVWAWREGRAGSVGTATDRVLCLFPMEPPIYARRRVDARFVGHPLADRFPLTPDRAAARRALGLDDHKAALAVLPGSRVAEIRRLGATFFQAAQRVAAKIPELQIVVPAANARCRAEIETRLPASGLATPGTRSVLLLDGSADLAMVASDVVLLASGTAALEAMLAKRPMVVGYRTAPLTYMLVKRTGMLKTDLYSLPNVLAGKRVVPELIQRDCTADGLATAIMGWFGDARARARLVAEFEHMHLALKAPGGAANAAARAIIELI